MADAAGDQPYESLAGLGLGQLDVLDDERPAELLEHCSAYLHGSILEERGSRPLCHDVRRDSDLQAVLEFARTSSASRSFSLRTKGSVNLPSRVCGGSYTAFSSTFVRSPSGVNV